MAIYWDNRRYYSLDYYLKQTYGRKMYKISLDAGLTCPNRDGTLGDRGCIFCSAGGSGDYAADRRLSITEQIRTGKAQAAGKYSGNAYIAYFQAYTNTYAPVSRLRKIFTEALASPDICILDIATRPDCLGPDVLELLKELSMIKPVWIELGLQTIHTQTAKFIHRGYELPVFEQAVLSLRALSIPVIVHTILGLPGEGMPHLLATVSYLNTLDIQGVKFQLLHILKGTDLAKYYKEHPFPLPDMEEYFVMLGKALSTLRPDIAVHRLTGDGPKPLLVAPLWTGHKRRVLNGLHAYLKEHDIWQGKDYEKGM